MEDGCCTWMQHDHVLIGCKIDVTAKCNNRNLKHVKRFVDVQ